MHIFHQVFLSALLVSARFSSQHVGKRSQGCPEVWNVIPAELTTVFLSNNTCNTDARASIRAAFHDCFPDSDCNGSVFLAGELSRSENQNIGPTIWMLGSLAKRHQVGIADMIQFAAAHAIATCAQGPKIPVLVGRTDSCTAAPTDRIPGPNITGNAALQMFQAKGFTAEDLAALMGAHTVSQQIDTFPSRSGSAQDLTPDIWDNQYYSDTLKGAAQFSFPSDSSLSNQTLVGPFYSSFSQNRTAWDKSFANAMKKMSLLGTTEANLMVDCTSALP